MGDDDEIFDATMKELERLFPEDLLGADKAEVVKHTVVRTPRSVYAAVPGRNKYRPSQKSPIPNFTLAGDWTSQKFLGSMEGAVLAGKLAAEVVADRAIGAETKPIKDIHSSVMAKSSTWKETEPPGVKGNGPIAWGGGTDDNAGARKQLAASDPEQLVDTGAIPVLR